MESGHKSFVCEVLTPEGRRVELAARTVVFPGVDGQIGILPDRAPVVASLGAGLLRVTEPDGSRREFFLARGFAQVRENRMTILADECLPVPEIDPEEAWDQIAAARRLPSDTPEAAALRDRVMREARTRFGLAQKHRSRLRERRRQMLAEDPKEGGTGIP